MPGLFALQRVLFAQKGDIPTLGEWFTASLCGHYTSALSDRQKREKKQNNILWAILIS